MSKALASIESVPKRRAPDGYEDCPWCKGWGEFQESYAKRGPATRIEECRGCMGRGVVLPELARELRKKPITFLPNDWTI